VESDRLGVPARRADLASERAVGEYTHPTGTSLSNNPTYQAIFGRDCAKNAKVRTNDPGVLGSLLFLVRYCSNDLYDDGHGFAGAGCCFTKLAVSWAASVSSAASITTVLPLGVKAGFSTTLGWAWPDWNDCIAAREPKT
jgi:hypothetical protein